MRIGGRDTTQDFIQTRLSLRDDYTRFMSWNGTHTRQGRRWSSAFCNTTSRSC